jgi:hypothetical protein
MNVATTNVVLIPMLYPAVRDASYDTQETHHRRMFPKASPVARKAVRASGKGLRWILTKDNDQRNFQGDVLHLEWGRWLEAVGGGVSSFEKI